MNILKKARTEGSTSNEPSNGTDAGSSFDVPEELRPHYPSIADATPYDGWHVHVLAAIRERAVTEMREARELLRESNERPGVNRSDLRPSSSEEIQHDLDSRTQRILDTDYSDYLAGVQHAARLKIAQHEWQIATRDLAGAEARIKADTCPVCRKCEPIRRGHVQLRPLIEGTEDFLGDPARRSEVPQINSCSVCALIARRDYLDELAAEPGAEYPTRTVRDAVRAAIGLQQRSAR